MEAGVEKQCRASKARIEQGVRLSTSQRQLQGLILTAIFLLHLFLFALEQGCKMVRITLIIVALPYGCLEFLWGPPVERFHGIEIILGMCFIQLGWVRSLWLAGTVNHAWAGRGVGCVPPSKSLAHSLRCGIGFGGDSPHLSSQPQSSLWRRDGRGLTRLTVGVGGIWEMEGSWLSHSMIWNRL